MSEAIRVEQVRAELVRDLRQKVLRPRYPIERSIYASDELPDAQHFAAWATDDRKNKIVGVASVHPEILPGFENQNCWRLRGMAVEPDFQGAGVGKAILRTCLDFLRRFEAEILWCNGRETAWNFYRRFGFEKHGEAFVIPESGEHFVMILRIEKHSG